MDTLTTWLGEYWKILFSGIGTLVISLIITHLLTKRRHNNNRAQKNMGEVRIHDSINTITGPVGDNAQVKQQYQNDKKS
jgi:hypothetical protein